jgi:hypothetical protein
MVRTTRKSIALWLAVFVVCTACTARPTVAITPRASATARAVASPTAARATTDTPRANHTPSPTATPAATPTATPTTTPTARPTATPIPTFAWSDSHYGLTGSWGCASHPYAKTGIQWYYSWTYTDGSGILGLPPGAHLVISVPDVVCASPEKDQNGLCLHTRISTPGDFASGVTLTDTVRANPGAYWVLGNEPNAHPNKALLISAPDYADWYHTMSSLLHRNDPSAILLNGGLGALEVVGNPPQDEYAGEFVRTYRERYGERPPIDIWNIHVYPDRGRPPAQIVGEFNAWRRTAGEDAYPLWITEFGYIRPDMTEDIVIDYMRESIRAFQAAGVERWFWYIGHDGKTMHAYNLWDCSGNLTRVGVTYRDLASGVLSP